MLQSPGFNALLSSLLLQLAYVTGPTVAHGVMTSPLALGGHNNPDYTVETQDPHIHEPVDFRKNIPFPCHGHHLNIRSDATRTKYTAGQEITVSLSLSQSHNGGSCQFSLSYDGGSTWGVIHSIIGGCPLQQSYPVKIPDNAPAGDSVLFAWTWFNYQGVREMYMNCAAVAIESSSTSLTVPALFVANVGGGTCETASATEQVEVNFPNPGVSVVRGQGQNVRDPPANCAPGGMVTLTSQGKSGQPAPPSIEDISATLENPSDAPKAPASTNVAMAGINLDVDLSAGQAKSAGDNSPGAVDQEVPEGQPEAPKEPQTPVDASENSDAPSIGQPHLETLSADSTSQCNNGGIQCSSDGKSFSICGLSGWISMGGLTPAGIRLDDAFTEFATPGSVAPGTLCRAGAIGLAGPSSLSDETLLSAPCTIGGIKCSEDGKSFYMCHAGTDTYVSMGPVAPGTQCQDGHIVLAGMKRLRKIRRSYLA